MSEIQDFEDANSTGFVNEGIQGCNVENEEVYSGNESVSAIGVDAFTDDGDINIADRNENNLEEEAEEDLDDEPDDEVVKQLLSREEYMKPQIDHVECTIWSRDQILEEAIGEVKVKVKVKANSSDTTNPDDKEQSLYDHRIFGYSKESLTNRQEKNFLQEEKKRMSNWGYIQSPIPFVIPGLAEKRALTKILGVDKGDILNEVVQWNAVIARYKESDFNGTEEEASMNAIEKSHTFIESFKPLLEQAKKEGLIYVITLSNRNAFFSRTHQKVLEEKLFVIKNSLFEDSSKISQYGELAKRSMWTKSFQILPGSYAIMDLLSRVDIDEEIKYSMVQWNGIQREKANVLNNAGIHSSYETLNTKTLTKVKKLDTLAAKFYSKYEILLGLRKQGLKPTALVSDVLPVQPPHWRDRMKVSAGGQTKYTFDCINDMYDKVLSCIETVRSQVGNIIPYEDICNYRSEWHSPLFNKTQMTLENLVIPSTAVKAMADIQKTLSKYLLSSKDGDEEDQVKSLLKRTAAKTANNRANLLGKRFDWTGRSVITGDPTLYLDEIGMPYDILKIHFREDIIRYLEGKGRNKTQIREMIDNLGNRYDNPIKVTDTSPGLNVVYEDMSNVQERDIYDALVEILKTKRYLAIRYPSLHKWNELGYRIRIVYDQTIHLNPLVCPGYNADFDGDQMSALLLSLPESVKEVDEILLPEKNDMDANGDPMMHPGQDMIMGLYILTLKEKDKFEAAPVKGTFGSVKDLKRHIELGDIDLHDKVTVLMPHYMNSNFMSNYYHDNLDILTHRKDYTAIHDMFGNVVNTDIVESTSAMQFDYKDVKLNNGVANDDILEYSRMPITSTAGRFLFNEIIPQDLGYVKRGKDIHDMQDKSLYQLEWDPDDQNAVISKTLTGILRKLLVTYNSSVCAYVNDKFKSDGYKFISQAGLSLSLLDINSVSGKEEAIRRGHEQVEANKKKFSGKELVEENFKVWEKIDAEIEERGFNEAGPENPIIMMAVSGARGKRDQIKQINGMRGIMMDTSNKRIETPITRNFIEGLDPLSYTISAIGACKGMIDRSRRTAGTGDYARHLFYGNLSQVITDGDCGDTEGILVDDYILEGAKEKLSKEAVAKKRKKIEVSDASEFEKAIDIWELEEHTAFGHQVVQLREEVIGRNPVEDILDTETGEVLFYANRPIHPIYYDDLNERLLKLQCQYSGKGVRLRSVFTCKCPTGKCARCYGYFFASHRHARVGDAVGTVTAQALSERATQLTMRTFHTGGIAKGDISAGFDQIQATVMFGQTSNIDITNRILPMLSLCTKEVIQKGVDDYQNLVNLLHDPDVRKSTLSETISGITYKGLTLASFGFVQLNLVYELFNKFMAEVRNPYLLNDINFKRVHLEIIATQAISNMKVLYAPESIYRTGEIIKSNDLIKENLKLAYEGRKPILAAPTLTGYKYLVVDKNNPLTSLFFQRAGELLVKMSLANAVDHLTSPIAALGVSNTMPLGEGMTYYEDTFKEQLDSPAPLITDYVKGFDTDDDLSDIDKLPSILVKDETEETSKEDNAKVQNFDKPDYVTVEELVKQTDEEDQKVIAWEDPIPTSPTEKEEQSVEVNVVQSFE